MWYDDIVNNKLKRKIYVALFTFLGVLVGFLVHACVEIWFASLLTADFARHSLGYSWSQWFTFHEYFAITTFALGILFGFKQGEFWWKVVYEQKRFDPFFYKLQKFLGMK